MSSPTSTASEPHLGELAPWLITPAAKAPHRDSLRGLGVGRDARWAGNNVSAVERAVKKARQTY
jgi:hypothetical protein